MTSSMSNNIKPIERQLKFIPVSTSVRLPFTFPTITKSLSRPLLVNFEVWLIIRMDMTHTLLFRSRCFTSVFRVSEFWKDLPSTSAPSGVSVPPISKTYVWLIIVHDSLIMTHSGHSSSSFLDSRRVAGGLGLSLFGSFENSSKSRLIPTWIPGMTHHMTH